MEQLAKPGLPSAPMVCPEGRKDLRSSVPRAVQGVHGESNRGLLPPSSVDGGCPAPQPAQLSICFINAAKLCPEEMCVSLFLNIFICTMEESLENLRGSFQLQCSMTLIPKSCVWIGHKSKKG